MEESYHISPQIPEHKKPTEPLPPHSSSVLKLHVNEPKQRTVKEILKDSLRQILASAIIMVIGFLALNWSSYYKIAKNEIQNLVGEEESQIDIDSSIQKAPAISSNLKASSSLEIQKRDIPPLDLEVAPLDDRIMIPRINENIPIVKVSSESLIKRDWDALEKEMQGALQNGVVHYPGTSLPGQTGNIVITGHSSYFPWDPGRFKDVFALLHKVVVGDRIVVYYEQDKYVYEVTEKVVVLPKDIEVLKQTPADQLTLITCTPVGTNLKRLIVKAKPVAINGKEIDQKVLR